MKYDKHVFLSLDADAILILILISSACKTIASTSCPFFQTSGKKSVYCIALDLYATIDFNITNAKLDHFIPLYSEGCSYFIHTDLW